ncbi:hypothetical protein [Thalassospira lohafexi]|uniref:hypothetical protein n=1 Tax=Thalassospira lohafexi TaxID=744227 RepID=UPI0013FD300F|nr:hypothetical protein [Thalassospira lohafexi]
MTIESCQSLPVIADQLLAIPGFSDLLVVVQAASNRALAKAMEESVVDLTVSMLIFRFYLRRDPYRTSMARLFPILRDTVAYV